MTAVSRHVSFWYLILTLLHIDYIYKFMVQVRVFKIHKFILAKDLCIEKYQDSFITVIDYQLSV